MTHDHLIWLAFGICLAVVALFELSNAIAELECERAGR
jgi:hypothetical protein